MRRTATKPDGFTLMELLIVFSIMAVLFGLSIGAFARISRGSLLDANELAVRAALLRSRINARTKATLTSVTVVPADIKRGIPALLRSAYTVTAGSWHFEEASGKTLGGKNRWAMLRSVTRGDEGTVGRCAMFNGGGTIVSEPHADLDPTHGFSFSMDLMVAPENSGAKLFSYGDTFSLQLGEKGDLIGFVTLDAENEEVRLQTGPDVIEPDAWTRVALIFDGLELMVVSHNVIEARKKVSSPLRRPKAQERLTIGSGDLKGRVDEVLYQTMIFEEDEQLDPDIDFQIQPPVTVRFDVDGRLDPRVHSGHVVIPMTMEDERVIITVKAGGVIR